MKVTVRLLNESWEPLQRVVIECYSADTRTPITEQTTDLGGIATFENLDDAGRFIFRPKVTRLRARLQLLNVIGDFWTIGDGVFANSDVWHLIADEWVQVDAPVGNYGVFLHVAPNATSYELCNVDFNGLNNIYVSNDGGVAWITNAIDMPASGFPSMFRRDIDGDYWVGYEDYPVYSGGTIEVFTEVVLVDEVFPNAGAPISFSNPIVGDRGIAIWIDRGGSGSFIPTLGGDLTWTLVYNDLVNNPNPGVGDPLSIFVAEIPSSAAATIAFTTDTDDDSFTGLRDREDITMIIVKNATGMSLSEITQAHFSDVQMPTSVQVSATVPAISVIAYEHQDSGFGGAVVYEATSTGWTMLRQAADDVGSSGAHSYSVAWSLNDPGVTWVNSGASATQANQDEVTALAFEFELDAAVGDGGHLLKSTNQGETWEVMFGYTVGGEEQKITYRFHDILVHPSNTNRICIAWSKRDPRDTTADEYLYISTSTNGGATWVTQEIENVGNGGGSPGAFLAWHRNGISCVLTAHNGSVDVFRHTRGNFTGTFAASTLFKTTAVDGLIHHDHGALYSNGANLYFVPRYFSSDPNEVYRSPTGAVWTTLNGPNAGNSSWQLNVNWDRSRSRLGVVYGSTGAFELWYLSNADTVVAGEEVWTQDEAFPSDGEELVAAMAR